jgi:nucleoside-diphosphate-sugar epimerase
MHVLVTGATGFIGGHVAAALVEAGHAVTALVRASSSRTELAARGVRFAVGDVLAPETLRAPVAEVDAVIHLASLLKMPWSPDFRSVNVGGTAAVVAAASSCTTPPVVVVVSSMAAAGPATGAPRREDEAPAPVSRYGDVKLAAERAASTAGVPLSIVRPSMVFGEGDRTVLKLFRSVARGLHVVPTRRSNAVSLVHARDLAEALVRITTAGERVGSGAGAGIYHVAADELIDYGDLGRHIAEALDVSAPRVVRIPSEVTFVAAALGEAAARLRDKPAFLNLDKYREVTGGSWTCTNAKAKSLGWRPAPLAQRLADTARWYREKGLI